MAAIQHLIADVFGSHIGKYSERLKLTKGGEVLIQAPLLHLESVIVASRGVSISADALEACCERGIPVQFLTATGDPYASIYAPGLTGTVLTRREQLAAYHDQRGVHLAIQFATGKIENQAATLKYMAKSRKESAPEAAEQLKLSALDVLDHLGWLDRIGDAPLDEARGTILAAEGNAAQVYWGAVRQIMPDHYQWPGRITQGATDPINSLLNYGYGILYHQIERAAILAGLDPYAGFIHTDRPGKPNLTLDLIEEFRQIAVDRVVFGLVNRDFIVEQDEKGLLTPETRKRLAEKVLQHLEVEMTYQGKKHPLHSVIQGQARAVAAFVRGHIEAYVPYKASW
jgi:CRISPR-associated protein Cas1